VLLLPLEKISQADHGQTDFDPENEAPDDDANSDSEESVDENAGTEHYVAVGYAPLLFSPRYSFLY
jgi:hypothetical protein